MDNNNSNGGRKKTTTGNSSGNTGRRGSGLGTGPVGSGREGLSGRGSGGSHSSSGSSGGSGVKRAALGGGGGLGVIIIIVLAVLMFTGKLDCAAGLLGGGGTVSEDLGSGGVAPGGEVNQNVAAGSRAKYTNIIGGGQDKVTIMLYLCGTDLESKYGMASSDMDEMKAASSKFGDNFNLIVYTGGCKKWKNGVSATTNQIYRIKNGKAECISSNEGSKAMTDPNTLSGFIKYCAGNYPANRYELILWDHGGGSVSGYGYDEKQSSGSMSLDKIDKALKDGGVKFDFVGFDACLMATAENALMLDSYADYLVASEETEPGIGWYYTNWLSNFAGNTSRSTLDVGKDIVDDFVVMCDRQCKGQKTTLSVIDLAEFSNTVPQKLSDFSKSISNKITNNDYKTVSNARDVTREFAQSSKIDQVDLVNLAENMGTSEGSALVSALKGAVKYNRHSSNMTNANGVSIYFPYRKTSYVDKACATYDKIGMDGEYSTCIRKFASLETGGQIASGGTSSPAGSLFGSALSGGGSGGSGFISGLLGSFLGGKGDRVVEGLDSSNIQFMQTADNAANAEYIAANFFDESQLYWKKDGSDYKITLSSDQWALIQEHGVEMSMFYKDGDGYIDLGKDYLFEFDDNGNLVADTSRTWVSINGQAVPYYFTEKIGNGTYTGYIPAYLYKTNEDGQKIKSMVKLLVVFEDNGDKSDAYISGAVDFYNGETETVAKALTKLEAGDELDFICDYYTKNAAGEFVYQDSYLLGDRMTVTDNMVISNENPGSSEIKIIYRFTDIYNQVHWSEAITL